MTPYNPALPPVKLVGIRQGDLNTLASNGLDQYLSEVESTLNQIGSLVYGNFPSHSTCAEIKFDASFLSFAFVILGYLCRSGLLVEICAIVAVIAFVLGIIIFLIKAFFCGM